MRLRAYAQEKGYRVVAEYSDVASGLNQNRRGLERMLKAAEKGKFKKLLIEYPDRLARFGYAYLECHLKYCGVKIEITSQKELEDAHTELVQDLLAVMTSSSARLYGARGGKKIRQGFRAMGFKERVTKELKQLIAQIKQNLTCKVGPNTPREGRGMTRRVRACLRRLGEKLLMHNGLARWQQEAYYSVWHDLKKLVLSLR